MVPTVAVALVLTVLTLVVCAWTGRRRASGVGGAGRRSGGGGDPWHGDPRPDVAGRPAGADAEAMSAEPDP
jgi:hypothetical protein